MAHIIPFPDAPQGSPWPSPAAATPAGRPLGGLAATVDAFLDGLLDALRLAWWDGSSLRLSRGGLESLVGLEPGDATPPRRGPVASRVTVRA
ncbi:MULTISPECIES: hypothetical protein [unclassified Methylobacterium]|uniref:hypothetical protein n=1 Tax=unclassified Methylobacterium TaxID=2615210 RepID=UPI0036F732CC